MIESIIHLYAYFVIIFILYQNLCAADELLNIRDAKTWKKYPLPCFFLISMLAIGLLLIGDILFSTKRVFQERQSIMTLFVISIPLLLAYPYIANKKK